MFEITSDYRVVIIKKGKGKDTKITGRILYDIQGYENAKRIFPYIPSEETIRKEFNPLTVLGDLNCLKLSEEQKYINIENVEDNSLDIHFIKEIKEIILSNKNNSIDDLELLRQKYRIGLEYNVLIEQSNPYSALLKMKKAGKGKNAEVNTTFVPLNYEFGKENSELLEKKYLNQNHAFSYNCNTVSEIIFAILHFIITHGYKFEKCALCKKWHARIPVQGQPQYCYRISPLSLNPYFVKKNGSNHQSKFINSDCQESMKKYNEILRNMKKDICKNFKSEEMQYKFENEYNEKHEEMFKDISIDSLIQMYEWVRDYRTK